MQTSSMASANAFTDNDYSSLALCAGAVVQNGFGMLGSACRFDFIYDARITCNIR
jgi:hypothetical protein